MTASVRHEFIREVNKSSRRLGCLTSSVEGGGGMHNLYNLSPGELFGGDDMGCCDGLCDSTRLHSI